MTCGLASISCIPRPPSSGASAGAAASPSRGSVASPGRPCPRARARGQRLNPKPRRSRRATTSQARSTSRCCNDRSSNCRRGNPSWSCTHRTCHSSRYLPCSRSSSCTSHSDHSSRCRCRCSPSWSCTSRTGRSSRCPRCSPSSSCRLRTGRSSTCRVHGSPSRSCRSRTCRWSSCPSRRSRSWRSSRRVPCVLQRIQELPRTRIRSPDLVASCR